MATYLVWSGGDGTSGTEAGGWTAAYKTLAAGITAANATGDVVKVHKTHLEVLSSHATYAFQADNVLVVCVDKDNADALATMDFTNYYIGHTSTTWSIEFGGARKAKIVGLALRVGGTGSYGIRVSYTDAADQTFTNCIFGLGTHDSYIYLGATDVLNGSVVFNNCEFKFAGVNNRIASGSANAVINGGSITGTAASTLITFNYSFGGVSFNGVDLSTQSGSLVAASAQTYNSVRFVNCKLHASATILATGNLNRSYSEVFVLNCSSGDTHYNFGHYDALGQTVAVVDTYVSDAAKFDGTNPVTWKITTTGYASFTSPYVSPWIETYHAGTSAITPSIEGLMINDATVAHNNEVWGEFSYQGTTGSVLPVFVDDSMALLGSSAAQTSAKTYSDWTASPVTDAGDSVFKLAATATITPAEIGMLRGRVCVGEASKTLYIDPKIRT